MKGIFAEMGSLVRTVLLNITPTIFWYAFFLKRLSGFKRCFGFLSEEFFDENFMKDKLCDIGGFGMTAKVITEYYGALQDKAFGSAALFNRTLYKQADWRFYVGNSRVFTIPNLAQSYFKGFLRYSYHAHKELDFLLSIDMYPGYDFSLSAVPRTPLMIWLRDPKGETELKNIATVDCELRANKMKNLDEFMTFVRKEREFFSKVYEQSCESRRPIIFVTNAHCLTPRAKRLFDLKEFNPHFLPNPIHYPSLERFEKSKKPTVCVLGRIDPVKRPWICFELAKKFKDVEFLICGNTSYPEVVNPIIEKYRTVDNLKFLGLVQGKQKEDILVKSWVLLNTSIHEGLPCSFLESFSCHTPILSSVNPDELVSKFGVYTGDNPGDGLDAKTMGQFEEALGKMLSDSKVLAEKGAQARKYIEDVYSFPGFEKNLRAILATGFRKNFEK